MTDDGLPLNGTASYARLGTFDSLQVLTATGNTASTCTNKGGNQALGQNPAPVTLVGATPVEADDIKNGNVTISSTTDPPVTPVPGAPGCENPNWTEDINDVAFTSARIRLFQDQTAANGGFGRWETLVLTANCPFNPPTSNSEVPSSGFTCTFRPGASERLLPLPPTWALFGRWEPHAPLAQGVTDGDPAPHGRAVELPLTSHAAQLALEPT